jgi:RimJ/RimL family protein N-acetyltransferase
VSFHQSPAMDANKSCDTRLRIMIALETNRLNLRQLSPFDAPFILKLLNEPSFLHFIGDKNVRTVTDAELYMANGPCASYARNNFGLLLVELRNTTEPIGICGLLQRDTLTHPDIGFAFLPAFWGHGYAYEAATAVLEDARSRLHLRHILGLTSLDNSASQRLLEKLGLHKERIIHMSTDDIGTQLYSADFDAR